MSKVQPATRDIRSRHETPAPQMELDLFGSPAAEVTGVATDVPGASAALNQATTDTDGLQPTMPRRTPANGERVIVLDGHALYYRFKRSSRRTIGFMIDESGLAVTAPRWVTLADVEAAIVEKKRWIFSKIAEFRERAARRVIPRVNWIDGATLPYLGHTLTVRLSAGAGIAQYDIHTHTLWLDLPPRPPPNRCAIACRAGCSRKPASSSPRAWKSMASAWVCGTRHWACRRPQRVGAVAAPTDAFA